MKNQLFIAAILVIVIMISILMVPLGQAKAINMEDNFYCMYAQYNPGYAVACLWWIMMELWDPLDWGDGDVDNTSSLVEYTNFFYCYTIHPKLMDSFT